MLKVSVVMNYFERQDILERTLWSICHFTNTIDPFEVVIVDDMSAPGKEAAPVVADFTGRLPVRLFERTNKKGKNCGIPLNIAARKATGEVLIIQDPDFVHMSPVVNQTAAYFADDVSKFVIAGCYSLSKKKQRIVVGVDFSDREAVARLRQRVERLPAGIQIEGADAWNCHPIFRPLGLGSAKAILRRDFNRLGGFDEDFHEYHGYEDTDFLRRVQLAGIPAAICPEILVYHQWHYEVTPEDSASRAGCETVHLRLFQQKAAAGLTVANAGREWGVLSGREVDLAATAVGDDGRAGMGAAS